ncbi:DUF1015 family protein [Blastococcus sp. TF02A-26]|uniref:DUF1015 family protein n=1 Tax=Blastococcus sp. TF02A-26 TaxID=2250577 RepID=UPI000DEB62D5|nr:DUF1015 domain-containing protein [Blastococcus sp. TF02A-26]RBY84659.1 DUF1015 domain-containing protein [Blastococcus sp. TF02A-26]
MPSPPTEVPPAAAGGLEVRPFRALTYRRHDPGQLARVSSPAYDLVTVAARHQLAQADPHNVVRLILPELGGTAPGADARTPAGTERIVDHAARTLREWEDQGVLVRDAEPALWVYELRPSDGTPATVGWLGAVTLPEPGSRAVLPHEDTFPVAVEGRRALLAATRTDLEPIVLAHDAEPAVAELTAAARAGEPDLRLVDSDGVAHSLWRVTDPAVLAELGAGWRRTSAVIADGHHRFAAALAHARREGAPGRSAVLALVTPMGAGGLRVEPIHRVLPGLSLDAAAAAAARGFRVTPLPVGSRSDLVEHVRRWQRDPRQSGFLVTDGRGLQHLDRPADVVRAAVPAEAPDAWRRLDVVLAHHGLAEQLWGRSDGPDDVLIAHDLDQALDLADERTGVALLLRAPSPAAVAAVAREGARMPRKSTLFVPKPRTGLVFRPHED